MEKMKRNLRNHQFTMKQDEARRELNFNIKKENLINAATVEIIDEYAEITKPQKHFKYYPLKQQVLKLNDHKHKVRMRKEAKAAAIKEVYRTAKRKAMAESKDW